MQGHFEQERALQERIEAVLATREPAVDVRDVELDAPREQVRLFIAHPEGVSLELCSRVTHHVHDLCAQYALEVSSPGSEPPLRHPRHFREAVGREVRIRRRAGRRPVTATIVDVDDDAVTIRRGGPDAAPERIPHGEIVRSQLVAPPVVTPAKPRRSKKGVAS